MENDCSDCFSFPFRWRTLGSELIAFAWTIAVVSPVLFLSSSKHPAYTTLQDQEIPLSVLPSLIRNLQWLPMTLIITLCMNKYMVSQIHSKLYSRRLYLISFPTPNPLALQNVCQVSNIYLGDSEQKEFVCKLNAGNVGWVV